MRRLLWCSAVLLTGACGGDEGPELDTRPVPVASPKTRVKPGEAGGGPAAPPAFAYNSQGLRDPLRSFLAELQAQKQGEAHRPRAETEEFDIDQYRLTALVTGSSQPKAMVEDPGGVGHTLKVGSRLGKNGGRVTRISSTGVLVLEEYVNAVGEKVQNPITLKLPDVSESIIVESQ